MLVCTFIILALAYYPKEKNSKEVSIISSSDIVYSTANHPYMTKSYAKSSNSQLWSKWGQKISVNQAKDTLVFKLKLPLKSNNDLTANLEAIIAENVPSSLKKKQKSKAVLLFYSSGIKIMQSFLLGKNVPPTKLSDFKDSSTYQAIQKEYSRVFVNNIEGLAGKPGAFMNINGVVERKPGVVTWYQKPILCTVYGNGYIPLEKLLKVAELF